MDLATSEYLKSKTKRYKTNSIWFPGTQFKYGFNKEDVRNGVVNGVTQTQFQEPVTFEKNSLFFQTQGTDAAIMYGFNPGELDVKVQVDFQKINSDELKFRVTGRTYGDRFPANSTYIKDKLGSKIFLGVSGVDNNAPWAPQVELLGTAFEGMSSFDFFIVFNNDETFKGVSLGNGDWYTPEQWNKIFDNLNPANEST